MPCNRCECLYTNKKGMHPAMLHLVAGFTLVPPPPPFTAPFVSYDSKHSCSIMVVGLLRKEMSQISNSVTGIIIPFIRDCQTPNTFQCSPCNRYTQLAKIPVTYAASNLSNRPQGK